MQPDAGPGGLAVLVLAREGDHVHSVFLVEEEKTHLQGLPHLEVARPAAPTGEGLFLDLVEDSPLLRFGKLRIPPDARPPAS